MTRVLIVEPDPPLMRVMGWILADAGFDVVSEHDFDQALSALPRLRPDITVLNGDMPAGRRAHRIAAVRTSWPGGRVVDLHHLQLQVTHETTTADLMLTKPFDAESLVNAIHRLSAERESDANAGLFDEYAAERRRMGT